MNLNGKTINPGEMRTQVTLQKRTVSVETGGFQVAGWTTIATAWAKWTNVHGSEVWHAQTVQAIEPATVLIRWRSDVDTTCAVLKGSTRYEIVSLDNIQERNEYIELKLRRMGVG